MKNYKINSNQQKRDCFISHAEKTLLFRTISLTFSDSIQNCFKGIQILLTKLPRLGWAPRRQPVFSTIKNAFLWPSKNISWRKAGTTLHSAKHSRVGTASIPQFYIQLVYRTVELVQTIKDGQYMGEKRHEQRRRALHGWERIPKATGLATLTAQMALDQLYNKLGQPPFSLQCSGRGQARRALLN